MTTRSTPPSSIIGSARSIVNGSGNCGLTPGSQGQSAVFAFQKCTWASTIIRLPAGCDRAGCALVPSVAPAARLMPNSRRVIIWALPRVVLAAGVDLVLRLGLEIAGVVALAQLLFRRPAGAVDHSPALDGRALADFILPARQVFVLVRLQK